MALIDLFKNEYPESGEEQCESLTKVLEAGLAAAEGEGSGYLSSGADDLRFQLITERKLEPDWLRRVNPKLAVIYHAWVTTNKARIDAVLARK